MNSSSSIFSGKTLVNLTLRIWEESLRASWRARWLLHLKQIPPNEKMYQSKRWDALLLGILVVLLVCHQLRFCHPPVRLEAKFSSTTYKQVRYRHSSSASVVSNGSKNWKFLKSNFTFFFFKWNLFLDCIISFNI